MIALGLVLLALAVSGVALLFVFLRRRSDPNSAGGATRKALRTGSATPIDDPIKQYFLLGMKCGKGVADDRTWSDLTMDRVLGAFNYTRSTIGAQVLFDLTRRYSDQGDIRHGFQSKIDQFLNPSEATDTALQAIDESASTCSANLPHLIFSAVVPKSPSVWLFVALGIAPLVLLLLSLLYPPLLAGVIAFVFINSIARSWMSSFMAMLALPFRDVGALIAAAHQLSRSTFLPQLERQDLLAAIQELRPVDRLRWFGLSGPENQLLSLLDIREYLNLFFLADVVAGIWAVDQLIERRSALCRLFRSVGEVDAAFSIASVRAHATNWTRPNWTAPGTPLICDGVTHPLVQSPVPNDLTIPAGAGVLLTGHNASGKSTLTRAVGVNAILAAAWGMCWADSWSSPKLAVATTIDRADKIEAGHSYFVSEILAITTCLIQAERLKPTLFLIDEILRGTSTDERIAAGAAILQYLARLPHYVIATTHDREMTRHLGAQFQFACFTGYGAMNDNQYVAATGIAMGNNAFALMAKHGVPPTVISQARSLLRTNHQTR